MGLLLFYSLRNLVARRTTTLLTAGGMALVVFVFTAVVMLAEGLEKTLVDTGTPENALVLRRSTETEMQSGLERGEAAIIEAIPEVATAPDGQPFAVHELVVLLALPKPGGNKSHVTVRGVGAASLALRPDIRMVAGRMPAPGSREIAVGQSVAKNFAGVELGAELTFGRQSWRIVGVFDAGKTGYSSEIWGEGEQLMAAFRRQAWSVVLFRLSDLDRFAAAKARLESDPRLKVDVLREPDYYRKQSEMLAKFLRILGLSLTAIFSIGAVVGAMITMFAAVAGRVSEIGVLRALGFSRGRILGAFLTESLLLGLLGGLLGLGAAAFLQLAQVSTTNFQTFTELAFGFELTPTTVAKALGFALGMGLSGGLLPAIRAARMNLVSALRS